MTTNETSNEEEHILPKQQEDPKATDKSPKKQQVDSQTYIHTLH